ncbi:MAG: helix-turn-helix transcriptional regulator [Rhodanobacter sp.]|nr:helix-turn-helix transcriptional regulator [Rhodanobacter sp.]
MHDSGIAHTSATPGTLAAHKHPFLVALGDRVRSLRARRGMTRKALSLAAQVSERHLANLEYGIGNASILVLLQITHALQCPLAELIGDVTAGSPEWLLIREMLKQCDEPRLRRVRIAIGEWLGTAGGARERSAHVALIGLRGAGKSTLGTMLAEDLGFPFIELSREIEKFAGCNVGEIQNLYGQAAYRRYERRALEEVIQIYPEAVIATPDGLVNDPAIFNLLLAHCITVWLQATPEDHMQRVAAQGDLRPIHASTEAMEDLKNTLARQATFYWKAEIVLNTSEGDLQRIFAHLSKRVREALAMPR